MASSTAVPEGEGGIDALLDASPDLGVHTSAAAELGFLLGLGALLAAPFSIMFGVALGMAAVGCVCSLLGVVATSRAYVAGRALAPLGLACAVVALVILGPRFAGVDTAFGDTLLPSIGDWLAGLNDRLDG